MDGQQNAEQTTDQVKEDERPINYYPLDAAKLQKGEYISPEWCEDRLGLKRLDADYGLQLLRFKDWVEHTRRAMGAPVVVRIDHHGLRILTDEDAAGYTTAHFQSGIRHARRSFGRKIYSVDVGGLSEKTRAAHERDIETQSRVIQAIKRANSETTLAPHKRATPGIAQLTSVETKEPK